MVRLFAAGCFATYFNWVLRSAWPAPEESPLPQADAWAAAALGGLGLALGVWAVGNVTPQARLASVGLSLKHRSREP